MKKILSSIVMSLLAFGLVSSTFADDKKASDKPKGKKKDAVRTFKGTASCAKCALKISDTCQTVIQRKITRNDKERTMTFYVAKNEVAKKFHKTICSGDKIEVVAKGKLKSEGKGKNVKRTVTLASIKKAPAKKAKKGKGKGKDKKEQKDS
ncbi:MAG: hypothetical protein ABGX43_04340 [Nitrospinaceae bacterium]